jgi:hypothetical protein
VPALAAGMLSSPYFHIGVAMAATNRSSIAVLVFVLSALAACGEEPAPHSVGEFIEDPILLEATMVRCGQDRAASRYEPECINARDAAGAMAKAREEASRRELETESERKRQALRRAQEAAAAARRRVQEAQRKKEEAEYYGEFDPLPREEQVPGTPDDTDRDREEREPVDPPAASTPPASAIAADAAAQPEPEVSLPVSDDASASDPATAAGTDLEGVREELKRRQDQR